MRKLPVAAALAALALWSGGARAAEPARLDSLLDAVSRTYAGLASGYFEGLEVREIREAAGAGPAHEYSSPVAWAFQAPGKFMREVRQEALGEELVCDGRQAVLYVAQFNQFVRHALEPVDSAVAVGVGFRNPLYRDPFADFRNLRGRLAGAREVRTDTLPLGEERVRCTVVAFDSVRGAVPPPVVDAGGELWLDPGRGLVLRQVSALRITVRTGSPPVELRTTTTFDLVRVGQPLPDSLFLFAPPPGAELVEQLGVRRPSVSALIGKPKIGFTLPDLAGKQRSLDDFKGRVVLLDFWASWCGPCRMEMPSIQKLHQEFKGKGLVVLAVNQGEEAERAGAFLKQNGYTFTALLDAGGTVGQQYGAAGIPTVAVIDRKGTIVAHFVGVRPEEELRAALAKAGLK
ncbi:MAG TPA: redoxin family protein [Candidatus Saccharimonadales bacterium]|nr:redoxin family protein [Candidatus Saccharimonadales bacterium]